MVLLSKTIVGESTACAHRGEPLNEGADDLTEVGRLLAKVGEGYRWKQMDQDYPKHSMERVGGISARRTIVVWSKQVEEGTV